ncbi:MAG: helix-turn-helix domain-containing protein [Thermoplasmata archaeon]|nr:helix-turn-helix domain-containing protein [Thermoplasmata archaeon]
MHPTRSRNARAHDLGSGARSATERRLRNLRTTTERGEEERLFIATLRVRIPSATWTGPFSAAHPHIRLEALNRSDVTPEIAVSDYWISGAAPGHWARELLSWDDVLKVDSLAEVGGGCLYRITYRNPPVVYLYRRLKLPLQFPLRIQAGCIVWEVVARRSEFDAVMAYARGIDPQLTVVSVRRRPLRSHLPLLTEVQQSLLSQAMAAGYFAVPRGITLTNLAHQLHRSKSAISESIALIEKKLLESAMRSGLGGP